jgi:hypothetical protein
MWAPSTSFSLKVRLSPVKGDYIIVHNGAKELFASFGGEISGIFTE